VGTRHLAPRHVNMRDTVPHRPWLRRNGIAPGSQYLLRPPAPFRGERLGTGEVHGLRCVHRFTRAIETVAAEHCAASLSPVN
jgi:hypothetical protein